MDLAALQSSFQQHLLTGDATVVSAIRPGGLGAERRLAIYHNAYRMRLIEALRDTFGHTVRYLGDELFNEVARRHVEAHPSRHASLREYGDGFDATLTRQLPQAPEVGELACMDRALRHAFDGPDARSLQLTDFSGVTTAQWDTLGLVLHPTYARLRFAHNTLTLWQALDQDSDTPPAMLLEEPGELLIWRRGHQPHFRSLEPLEAAALDMLHGGASFSATGAALADRFDEPELPLRLGAALRRWIDDGLIVAIR